MKNKRIYIRLSEGEEELLKDISESAKMTKSEWIREQIKKDSIEETKDENDQ